MNYIKIFILLGLFFIFPGLIAHAIELKKTEKTEIDLSILFAPVYEFNIDTLINGFYFKGAKIGLISEYLDRIKFTMKCDFSEINNETGSLSPDVLEDIYFQYTFFEQLAIRCGQFKVPVGEEICMGITERPYLNHSIGSDRLIPGRRRGVMVAGEDCFSFIGYKAGVFNTSPPEEPINESPYISTAGNIYLSWKLVNHLKIKSGYSIYYSFEEIFAQSCFFSLQWKLNTMHSFSLFGEYLEERFYHYQWNNSIFLSTFYRLLNFEIYFTGELYQENVGIPDNNDCFQINTGINSYWINDSFKAGIGYILTNEYEINEIENRVYMMFYWEL